MRRPLLAASLALVVAAPSAAQSSAFQSARPVRAFAGMPAGTPSGGFLMGADDCNSTHQAVGTGDQLGVPFVTGTTGSEGQSEANCYAFGMTAIDNDVWFDWTADQNGLASVSTCGGTSVDTKIAIWPVSASCPSDGSSLACNDDACALQSSANWMVTAAASYTIQLGTFPGAAGGSGSFDVTQGPGPPCGTYDDGTSENALGLTAGGEIGWLHHQDCLMTVDLIETAYGTPIGTCLLDGHAARIACYEDADCDGDPTTPVGGMTLMWSLATTVTNSCQDILTTYPYPGSMGGVFTRVAPSSCTWVMATTEQIAGEFAGPMDQTNPTPQAWVVGQTPTGGTLDIADLNNNNVPPLQTDAIGFPTAWLLRATGGDGCGDGYPATCSAVGCPCGNDNPALCVGGCLNSTGLGAQLSGFGVASISNDTFRLDVQATSNQPGLFFQGNLSLASPPTFGDGLRCCGSGVVRIGTWLPSGNATNTATGNQIGGIGPPISQHPGNSSLLPGDFRCYQWWFRDTNGGPCGQGFNLANSIEVIWAP